MSLMFFDTEIMGTLNPQFLICWKNENDETPRGVWADDEEGLDELACLLKSRDYTWVGFNSSNFDLPLVTALMRGANDHQLKEMADNIITQELNSWATYRTYNIEPLDIDHVDLREVAPGVMTSLKTYAGRMNFPHLKDLPFTPDTDLTPEQRCIVKHYCFNDVLITEALFRQVEGAVKLRVDMSREYGIDLRSKSDAQIAQAILVKRVG